MSSNAFFKFESDRESIRIVTVVPDILRRGLWLTKLLAWLAPPKDLGTVRSRTARNVYFVLIVSLPVAIVLPSLGLWSRPEENFDGMIIGSVVAIILSVLFLLLKLEWIRFVSHALVFTSMVAVIAVLLLNGGIRDMSLILLPVVLLFASVLLGSRSVLFYGSLISLMVIGLYAAEVTYWIPNKRSDMITLDNLILVLFTIALITFYLHLTFAQIVRGTQQNQHQSESLKATINKLQQIRSSLEQRTTELSLTNEHLIATQRQLVEAEKMASLGSLVAGVSHEINTPLGIGITAATTLATMTEELQAHYQCSDIRRSYFEEYLANAAESNRLIVNNLLRVDQLVQSFKQLSVDQLTLERRKFQLKTYLEEIVRGLEPMLRSGQHTLLILVDEAITIDSYPGALAQVITNLIVNSVMHGYSKRSHGNLCIRAAIANARLHLIYQDDGVGIDQAHLTKIYEPFFTTARDRGGTGLGLHIVYNLVTQKLGGTIRHESELNAGVTFYLDLPLYVCEEEKV